MRVRATLWGPATVVAASESAGAAAHTHTSELWRAAPIVHELMPLWSDYLRLSPQSCTVLMLASNAAKMPQTTTPLGATRDTTRAHHRSVVCAYPCIWCDRLPWIRPYPSSTLACTCQAIGCPWGRQSLACDFDACVELTAVAAPASVATTACTPPSSSTCSPHSAYYWTRCLTTPNTVAEDDTACRASCMAAAVATASSQAECDRAGTLCVCRASAVGDNYHYNHTTPPMGARGGARVAPGVHAGAVTEAVTASSHCGARRSVTMWSGAEATPPACLAAELAPQLAVLGVHVVSIDDDARSGCFATELVQQLAVPVMPVDDGTCPACLAAELAPQLAVLGVHVVSIDDDACSGCFATELVQQLAVHVVPVDDGTCSGCFAAELAPQLAVLGVVVVPIDDSARSGYFAAELAPQLAVHVVAIDDGTRSGCFAAEPAPQLTVHVVPIDDGTCSGRFGAELAPQLTVDVVPIDDDACSGYVAAELTPQLAVLAVPIDGTCSGWFAAELAPQLTVLVVPIDGGARSGHFAADLCTDALPRVVERLHISPPSLARCAGAGRVADGAGKEGVLPRGRADVSVEGDRHNEAEKEGVRTVLRASERHVFAVLRAAAANTAAASPAIGAIGAATPPTWPMAAGNEGVVLLDARLVRCAPVAVAAASRPEGETLFFDFCALMDAAGATLSASLTPCCSDRRLDPVSSASSASDAGACVPVDGACSCRERVFLLRFQLLRLRRESHRASGPPTGVWLPPAALGDARTCPPRLHHDRRKEGVTGDYRRAPTFAGRMEGVARTASLPPPLAPGLSVRSASALAFVAGVLLAASYWRVVSRHARTETHRHSYSGCLCGARWRGPMLLAIGLGWLLPTVDGAGTSAPLDAESLQRLIASAGGATVLLAAFVETLGLGAVIAAAGGAATLIPALVERLGLQAVTAMLGETAGSPTAPTPPTTATVQVAAVDGATDSPPTMPPGLEAQAALTQAASTPVPDPADRGAQRRRELCARGAETRVEARTRRAQITTSPAPPPSLCARSGARRQQTQREEAYWEHRRRQWDAGVLLGQIPRRTWALLAMRFRALRWLARARVQAAYRAHVLQRLALAFHPGCRRFVRTLRERSARRRTVLALLQGRPQPMVRDVGYDSGSERFSFRNASGAVSHVHPAGTVEGPIPAYSDDGSVVAPMSPPVDSSVVLCPERNGGWCYYDTTSGRAAWHAPEGSTPLRDREVRPASLPDTPPPRLPPGLALGGLQATPWMALWSDADGTVLLHSRITGAVREAPWISLRTSTGVVYFANLESHETRWLPPHRWMEGWVARPPWASLETVGQQDPWHQRLSEWPILYGTGRRTDDRDPLPQEFARRRVDGGAPCMLDPGSGVPQYPPDEHDTALTYPLADYSWAPLQTTRRRSWESGSGWLDVAGTGSWTTRGSAECSSDGDAADAAAGLPGYLGPCPTPRCHSPGPMPNSDTSSAGMAATGAATAATAAAPPPSRTPDAAPGAAVAVQRAWRRWRDDWERRLDGSAPVLEPQASAVDDALASGFGCERVLRAVVVLQRAWRWYANEMLEYGVWDEEDYEATAEQLEAVPVTTSPPFRFLVRVRLHAPVREWCLMGLGVSAHYRDGRRWRVNGRDATG